MLSENQGLDYTAIMNTKYKSKAEVKMYLYIQPVL